MKKLLIGLILILGICALSSCSKKCDCKAKYNGEVVYEDTVDLQDGEKCSDFNKTVKIPAIGVNAEVQCKADF
jgi:hypothetical protein